jgi:pyridoxamine 5'-phosphate oxidase
MFGPGLVNEKALGLNKLEHNLLQSSTEPCFAMDEIDQSHDVILAQCWALLERGAADRRHGFHHPAVSTLGADGRPKARIVILRAAQQGEKSLRFHTDIRTPKWQELAINPHIAFLFYDEAQRVQLRVEGVATLHAGNETARAAWLSSQSMSRVCYGVAPAPGTEIVDADHYVLPARDETATIGYENFGAVVTHVESIEWLFLKQSHNQRALFDLRNNTSKWLVP